MLWLYDEQILQKRHEFHKISLDPKIISGAIVSHLTRLGIEVNGDGGLLFIMALIVFISCGLILIVQRGKVLKLIGQITKKIHLIETF